MGVAARHCGKRRVSKMAQQGYSVITKLIAKEVVGTGVNGTDASLSSRPTCA